MNCQEFEKIVLALARHQLTEGAARDGGMTHAKVCAQCALRLAEEQGLISSVRAAAAEVAREEAPARVEAALLVAFRQASLADVSTAGEPSAWPMLARTKYWPGWRLAGVAAAIVILISGLAIDWRDASSRDSQGETRSDVQSSLKPVASQTPLIMPREDQQIDDTTQRSLANGTGRLAGRRTRRAKPVEEEVVTQFFALREGEDVASFDSLNMVRVELSWSSLTEVGLMVNPEATNEPVKADVLLGQDGLARAIRFVR